MRAQDNCDAGFFSAVHQLLEGGQASSETNRREADRLPFTCIQLMAPIYDGQMPDQSEFRRVQCQDLSQGGFSFQSDQRPDYGQLVIALGAVPFKFVTADVIRQKKVDAGGRTEYLVGCRFTGRIPS